MILIQLFVDGYTGTLFHDLNSGPQNPKERTADIREVVREPGEYRHCSKRGDANEEVEAKLIRSGVGDAAENWIAVHLCEGPDDAEAKSKKEKRKQPVDEL